MNAADELQQISFHDSNLTGISRRCKVLVLALEDVSVGEDQCAMDVAIDGIDTITRDRLPIDDLCMDTPDGEIPRLSQNENEIMLVVSWHRHSPRSEHTCIYNVAGKFIRLAIERK
jgi:hypothetical protein